MISTLPLSIALLLLSTTADAAPRPVGGLSMDLRRRRPAARSFDEAGPWARNQREAIHAKYGRALDQDDRRRSTGTNLLVNQDTDSSFYGSLALGTPAVSYNIVFDTGSADFWIASSNCTSGCENVPTFDPSSSSSFKSANQDFSITYGTGHASGTLATDVVQLAGFSVTDQVFAPASEVATGLLSSPVSGIMGMAWQSIASSNAMPFWQNLVANNAWDQPLMAFQLSRYLNVAGAQTLEQGGQFSMGFLNSSLYTGDVEYIDLVDDGSYWLVAMTGITVQGNSVSPGSGSTAYAAIDTGTTLVGGPSDEIANIFSNIPDSVAGTGDYDGYYLYPCDTSVNITLNFGGKDWSISSDDFLLQQVSRSQCLGAFFVFDSGTSGGSSPSWIVGDTFLKNVYSVYRYSPPAVGFAELSSTATAMNGDIQAEVPQATIGSVAASVAATS
ncbi:acid protease, partial [Cylindrobasidium torrendii FP15055 ss-10]